MKCILLPSQITCKTVATFQMLKGIELNLTYLWMDTQVMAPGNSNTCLTPNFHILCLRCKMAATCAAKQYAFIPVNHCIFPSMHHGATLERPKSAPLPRCTSDMCWVYFQVLPVCVNPIDQIAPKRK